MRAVALIRWCRHGLAAAAVFGLLRLGHAQDTKPDIDQEMKAAFRESFVYAPKAAADAPATKPATDVVLLRRVIVRNRWESQGLDQAVARQNAVDDHFTLYKGGAIARLGPMEVGTWAGGTGLALLKFAW